MAGNGRTIYTIGHSTHSIEKFISLLKRHSISSVVDVRSSPYSRFEHFNREVLSQALQADGIKYIFMGRELGARREEPECYVDGQAVYERIAKLPIFNEGIMRLQRGVTNHIIALMCTEKDPLNCHRAILVSRHLRRLGICVQHILSDGELESHDESERRLVRQLGLTPTLFEPDLTDLDLIERAYKVRGLDIGYRATGAGVVQW